MGAGQVGQKIIAGDGDVEVYVHTPMSQNPGVMYDIGALLRQEFGDHPLSFLDADGRTVSMFIGKTKLRISIHVGLDAQFLCYGYVSRAGFGTEHMFGPDTMRGILDSLKTAYVMGS